MTNFRDKANLIWEIADLLRGRYKQSDYGKVILPFTVLRRLDSVLEPTKKNVLENYDKYKNQIPEALEKILNRAAGTSFHNRSKFDFNELVKDHNNIGANLRNYINGFSENARDIFIEYFKFDDQIQKLEKYNLLYLVISKFADEEVSRIVKTATSVEIGYIFEELIRKFAEASNETAGEHFTPREVIKLMVNLLFREDTLDLTRQNIIKTLYDPACGTGGMLSVAEEYLNKLNPQSRLEVFGQEINPESYAICKSDMLIKGQNTANMKFGNTFNEDGLENNRFDYMLSNPPFGVNWRNAETEIRDEYERRGFKGRFGAGLPSISDGSLLFLQNMLAKRKPIEEGGSRLAIVFNGSPLFSGGAGSGQSDIRRWIIENDWLEAIVALPDQLFYNTGISTYIWVLSNDKSGKRKGKVQLVNATGAEFEDKGNPFYLKMLRSLGDKRKKIGDKDEGETNQIGYITNLYFEFEENEFCKIFDNHQFGYWRITVERPLRLNFQTSRERVQKIQDLHDAPHAQYLKTKEEVEETTAELSTADKQKIRQAENQYLKERIFAPEEIEEIKGALKLIDETKLYKNREEFLKDFHGALKDAGYKPSNAQKKKILECLSERDQTADICYDSKGSPEPDPELRDYENVPLIAVPEKDEYGEDVIDRETINGYFRREVLPHVPDAWIDWDKTKIGYEINITKYFYKYKPLRSLAEIRADILALETETDGMIKQAVGV
ncbi:MAG: type I restriction-modification system subunit M [Acidobacteriota bacterium]|nr:type I restriction-modification system subunit M [Acidobacteriota bacterium]